MRSLNDHKLHLFVPVYNRASITNEFINSLLKQKFSNFNLYIIDDNSDDNTVNIVKKFSELDSRVYLIQTEGNLWWGGSITFGLRKIYRKGLIKSSDYIGFMNDDINIKSDVLFELINLLKDNPKYIISPVRVRNKIIMASGSK